MEQTTRVHRVGSLTSGLLLIGGGVSFLLCSVFQFFEYEQVFRFWPIILVVLGIELLCSNARRENIIYDKGAIFLVFMLTLFSMGLAAADMAFRYHTLYF